MALKVVFNIQPAVRGHCLVLSFKIPRVEEISKLDLDRVQLSFSFFFCMFSNLLDHHHGSSKNLDAPNGWLVVTGCVFLV